MSAKPFLSYVGGKRRLASQIAEHMPAHIRDYWEPFVGGGAMFFHIHRRVGGQAHLSDMLGNLTLAYEVVRDNVDELVTRMRVHQGYHEREGREYFESVRRMYPMQANPITATASYLYLNKTCFRSIMSVNQSGEMKCTWGGDNVRNVYNEAALREASAALQGVEIAKRSFEFIEPGEDDVVYCDPPYAGGGRTDYTQERFSNGDQRMLAIFAQKWADRGATVLISNFDTPLIRELYTDGEIIPMRSIQSMQNGYRANPRAGEVLIKVATPE